MKKRLLAIVLMFLLVGPFFVIAEEETSENSCTGFWGSLSCFFFGNPENRAGKGWFERRAVVGL